MTIDFRKNADKLFTQVFYKVRKAKARYVVVYGGSSSSKSYSVHQNELINLMQSGEGNTLVFRKHSSDLRDSCYTLFINLIAKYGLNEYFKATYSGDNRAIKYLPTGRRFVFRGLDDVGKIKSIAGVSRVMIEEADQITFDDFTEIIRRIRGYENAQFIFILNPVSENHWIKTKMVDETGPYHPNTEVLKFTYLDNCNNTGESYITKEDIANLELLKQVDENQYRIYALGEWGGDYIGRVYNNFQFVDSFPPNLDEWIWLDFGFTNDPTAIGRAGLMGGELYLDEYCYETNLTNQDISAKLTSYGINKHTIIIADSAEQKSIEEIRRLGWNIKGAVKGKDSILNGIDILKRYKLNVTKISVNLKKELENYIWIKDRATGEYLNTPIDSWNHHLDGIRYIGLQFLGEKFKPSRSLGSGARWTN